MALSSKTAGVALLSGILVFLAAHPVEAAELKKETAAAFDRYIGASEGRIKSELHDGLFLFIDELPETRRAEAYAQLRTGQMLVKQVNTTEEGHPIEVPHGLIHDWIGLLFIPNSSLAQTLAVVQDYDNHENIYKPEIRRSKLLNRNGDNFKVFLQFYKRSLVTVVIDADFDINYERFGANRAVSRSYSTRLAEVENSGQTDERELPVDDAHGYLWRLYSYWRFEEKDGGVYVQLESIGLSRAVPAIIGWLVNPLLRSIPRGTISSLLGATRAAVTNLRRQRDSDRTIAKQLLLSKGNENLQSVGCRATHQTEILETFAAFGWPTIQELPHSWDRRAFVGTNPAEEPITSGLPVRTWPLVRRTQSSGVARGVDRS